MKKIIILSTISCLFFWRSSSQKLSDSSLLIASSSKINTPAFKNPLTRDEVIPLAFRYQELVAKLREKYVFRQINLDIAEYQKYDYTTSSLTFIATTTPASPGIEVSDDPSIVIRAETKEDTVFNEIKESFPSTLDGMDGQPAICPSPDPCPATFAPSKNPHVLTEKEVEELAGNYLDLVQEDYAEYAIQQIKIEGYLLNMLLESKKSVKLIAAAEKKTKSVFIIGKFWSNEGSHSYYKMQKIFGVCPPPKPCEEDFISEAYRKAVQESLKKKRITKPGKK